MIFIRRQQAIVTIDKNQVDLEATLDHPQATFQVDYHPQNIEGDDAKSSFLKKKQSYLDILSLDDDLKENNNVGYPY